MPTNVDFGSDRKMVVMAVARVFPVQVHLWYEVEFPLVFVDLWLDDEFSQEVAQPMETLICFRVGVDVHGYSAVRVSDDNLTSEGSKCHTSLYKVGVTCAGRVTSKSVGG